MGKEFLYNTRSCVLHDKERLTERCNVEGFAEQNKREFTFETLRAWLAKRPYRWPSYCTHCIQGDVLRSLRELGSQASTSPTKVVHCRREPYDVYIGRPSKWGNPFTIGPDGTREAVIEKYRRHLLAWPGLMADLPELKGKTLGCWCAPYACHGDVLAELANALPD